jgi:hypothetical protein
MGFVRWGRSAGGAGWVGRMRDACCRKRIYSMRSPRMICTLSVQCLRRMRAGVQASPTPRAWTCGGRHLALAQPCEHARDLHESPLSRCRIVAARSRRGPGARPLQVGREPVNCARKNRDVPLNLTLCVGYQTALRNYHTRALNPHTAPRRPQPQAARASPPAPARGPRSGPPIPAKYALASDPHTPEVERLQRRVALERRR